MCGISGFNFKDEKLINQMNLELKHRGPDSSDFFCDEKTSLGHTRLSIIDLSPEAGQPMEYNGLQIVFNGEIYNYKQICDELNQKGHQFKLKSDTEMILHAYAEWGENCVSHFNGMWAFCIYDTQKNKLFLSRDRFGIKPLHYFFEGGKFIFSSEIRAILKHNPKLSIDSEALNFYFYQKYILPKHTIFNEIKTLPPAHNLIFDLKNSDLKINRYYDLKQEIAEQKKIPINERLEKIKKTLPKAVEKRLLADVPVGSFLSGGIDSSYISAIVSKLKNNIKVFTIGFSEKTFDESNYAKKTADFLKLENKLAKIDLNEDLIFEVINKMDTPFGDPAIIPTYLLSKMTRKNVTVALSGDGGDEVFAGYDTYKAYKISKFTPLFFLKTLSFFTKYIPGSDKNLSFAYKLKKFSESNDKNPLKRHFDRLSQTSTETRKNLLKELYSEINFDNSKNNLETIQIADFEYYLQGDILQKTDMASMYNSLEARVPFLDHELVPTVLSLPEKLMIKKFQTKHLLKKIALTILPKEIIFRQKRGFSVPLSAWFKKSERMQKIITEKKFYSHNLLNYEYSQKLLIEHLKNKRDNSRVLWLILCLNVFFDNFSNQKR